MFHSDPQMLIYGVKRKSWGFNWVMGFICTGTKNIKYLNCERLTLAQNYNFDGNMSETIKSWRMCHKIKFNWMHHLHHSSMTGFRKCLAGTWSVQAAKTQKDWRKAGWPEIIAAWIWLFSRGTVSCSISSGNNGTSHRPVYTPQ